MTTPHDKSFEELFAVYDFDQDERTLVELGFSVGVEQAQPVQPAGAQGEPVHFRAVLCSEHQNQAVGVVPKVVGFVDRKAAEQFILEKRDFQGWKYNLESLYTAPPAVAVNEQLLDACKSVQNRLRPKTELREKIDAAIAAAEAAKGEG